MNKDGIVIEVNTNEHRAPTDQSVRLLNEMQETAVRNIIERVNVAENGFKFASIFYKDELRGDVRFDAKFNFNGEIHYINGFIAQEEVYRVSLLNKESLTTSDAFQIAIRNKVALVIAEWLPIDLVKKTEG